MNYSLRTDLKLLDPFLINLITYEISRVKYLYEPIIRDYHTEFWLSPEVSTEDPIISPRALAQGLIMVEG